LAQGSTWWSFPKPTQELFLEYGQLGFMARLLTIANYWLDYIHELTCMQRLAYSAYYAIGFWILSTNIIRFFSKGWGMPKFGLTFDRSLVKRTHALSEAFLLVSSVMWWAFPCILIRIPLMVHTITGFILLPDMRGVKVTSWTTVLLVLSVNSWELVQSFQHPWTAVDHYRIFHALSGFANARFWVMIFKLAGFEGATHSTGMMMAGWNAIVLILGPEYGMISYWGVSTVLYCVSSGTAWALQSTISKIMNAPSFDKQTASRAISKLTALQGAQSRTVAGAQSQCVANFIQHQTDPLLLAARFLDQDGDGVISKEDIKQILSKQRSPDLIFNSLHNWTAISVKDAVSQKPFLLKAVANDMTAVLLEKQVTVPCSGQNRTFTEAEKSMCSAPATLLTGQGSRMLGTTDKRSCPEPQANKSPPC